MLQCVFTTSGRIIIFSVFFKLLIVNQRWFSAGPIFSVTRTSEDALTHFPSSGCYFLCCSKTVTQTGLQTWRNCYTSSSKDALVFLLAKVVFTFSVPHHNEPAFTPSQTFWQSKFFLLKNLRPASFTSKFWMWVMFCWYVSAFHVLLTTCGSFTAFACEREQTKHWAPQRNCSIAQPRGETLYGVPLMLQITYNATLFHVRKYNMFALFKA